MKNYSQTLRFAIAVIFALWSLVSVHSVFADDIDVFVDNKGNSGAPNVLFILDNAANFSANADTCTYDDGSAPSLNGTAGGIEQCALYNVVSSLPVNADGSGVLNIGLMAYNANNIADINNANCGGSNGGCLMFPLIEMTAPNKIKFMNWVKSWRTTGGAGNGYIKANGEATSAAMQEAWAYYAGQTGLSGRSYAGVQPSAGCQNNFVIFIGNAFNTSGTPGDGGSTSPSSALSSAGGSTVTINIPSKSYGAGSFSCGTYSMKSHTDSSGLYADEWARFMYSGDLYSGYDGVQNITTYTIGLLGSACKPDYPALLDSMATAGKGKYYGTSNYGELAVAIANILNEVQAVNSVFASASLPVSVNAQGTYLNQIFLGMFRPDQTGSPRWLGNLKQYQFSLKYTDPKNPNPFEATLFLGDANNKEALSAAGTGFIEPSALSFWTYKDTSKLPDSSGGFFINNPRGTNQDTYDAPDGELVERGGVAQQLRSNSGLLQLNYATSPSGPRRLYTYCPAGSSCNADLTNSSNAFATTNSGIAASAFGTQNSVKVSSILRTGSTGVVTTIGPHGFSTGTSVTISGATPVEYNGPRTITVTGANTFTISGLPDLPTTPTQGTFSIALSGAISVNISSMSRASSPSAGNATELVTVNTTTAHGFVAGNKVSITGTSATPNGSYNGNQTVFDTPTPTSFRFSQVIYPVTPALNSYRVAYPSRTVPITTMTNTGKNGVATVTTSGNHLFHPGQTVILSGGGGGSFDGTYTLATASGNTFTFSYSGNAPGKNSTSAAPSTTTQTISTLTRTGTTDSSTATATGLTANWFANGDTVSITTTGSSPNESAYAVNSATITCSGTCTSFTYAIQVSPSQTIGVSSATASLGNAITQTIAASNIQRANSGTTATVTGLATPISSEAGQYVISQTGTAYSNESAYAGTWSIQCVGASPCTSFTFGPIVLSPLTAATGTIYATSFNTPPDRTTLINWVRGEDNAKDEPTPGSPNNVRMSIHGDVLHSRPAVVNYGDSRGLVVFYGANDGVFRAVNGSQKDSIGTSPAVQPGGELWGLIFREHYQFLNRQRIATPELQFPGTITPGAQPKDYFADGSPGLYQEYKADGTINKAYIYVTMRRGGSFLYAIDVTNPLVPTVKWRIGSDDADFSELGQTWSRPRLTKVKGYSAPVVVFGGGYDRAEDTEPPGLATSARAIYVVDADSGAMVWRATSDVSPGSTASSTYNGTSTCAGTTSKASCQVPGMNWAIPADLSFVDRDNDGYIERLYATDVGGNVWRVDLEPAAGSTPDKWQVSKLAAIGCSTGVCSSGGTPRKLFYPPSVVFVGPTGGSTAYDAVMVGTGDREHPLATNAAYNVTNRLYVLKDVNTGKGVSSPGSVVTEAALSEMPTQAQLDGGATCPASYYFTLNSNGAGEKVVNAPLTTRGTVFFGTNRPVPPSPKSCTSNLGEARGYALTPFSCVQNSTKYDGGGLPPSAVSGVVNINVGSSVIQKDFCIGCGGLGTSGSDGKSALGSQDLDQTGIFPPKRKYWYTK